MYTLSGFAVGAIVGLTGVGGGSLMTPLLVLLFGVHPATAVGTDLLYAAMTKAGGTVAHSRKGHIEWRITLRLAAGSIPAAALTVLVLSQLPKGSTAISHIISHGLGFALMLTAIAILFGRKLREYASQQEESPLRQRYLGKITVLAAVHIGGQTVQRGLIFAFQRAVQRHHFFAIRRQRRAAAVPPASHAGNQRVLGQIVHGVDGVPRRLVRQGHRLGRLRNRAMLGNGFQQADAGVAQKRAQLGVHFQLAAQAW